MRSSQLLSCFMRSAMYTQVFRLTSSYAPCVSLFCAPGAYTYLYYCARTQTPIVYFLLIMYHHIIALREDGVRRVVSCCGRRCGYNNNVGRVCTGVYVCACGRAEYTKIIKTIRTVWVFCKYHVVIYLHRWKCNDKKLFRWKRILYENYLIRNICAVVCSCVFPEICRKFSRQWGETAGNLGNTELYLYRPSILQI